MPGLVECAMVSVGISFFGSVVVSSSGASLSPLVSVWAADTPARDFVSNWAASLVSRFSFCWSFLAYSKRSFPIWSFYLGHFGLFSVRVVVVVDSFR